MTTPSSSARVLLPRLGVCGLRARRRPAGRGRRDICITAARLSLGPGGGAAAAAPATSSARIEDIRNIGIIAHVDAGKTTTTEKMLFFSGALARAGRVDHGNTVTDFLPLERKRGITIQSAAITLGWPPPAAAAAAGRTPCTINLIDTPGHQDFRFEVDRCLPILDGAVCILDAVEGVEAHTERVWATAHGHRIPRIVFVNKLDREGASFRRSVRMVASQLNGWPLVCQIPWWGGGDGASFTGIIDLVSTVGHRWRGGKQTAVIEGADLRAVLAAENAALLREMDTARQNLIETLADRDEAVMEAWMSATERGPGGLDAIPPSLLREAIRRLIRPGDGRLVPVLVGASLHGIGVEQLLDGVVDYLPSPAERPDVRVTVGAEAGEAELGELLLLAKESSKGGAGGSSGKSKRGGAGTVTSVSSVFKVFNHPIEGLLFFVRIYSGTLDRNAPLWNTRLGEAERPMGLVQVAAGRTGQVQQLGTGHIGALRGLRRARTGDTILTITPPQKPPAEMLARIRIRPAPVPTAVATLAIDAYGNTAASRLQDTLEALSREDPSLQWSRDQDTDQFVVQGMGTMHLEIARAGIRERCDAVDKLTLGEVEVEYRETVTAPTGPHRHAYERDLAGKVGRVTCVASLGPWEEGEEGHGRGGQEGDEAGVVEKGNNLLDIRVPAGSLHRNVSPEDMLDSLRTGCRAGLARGPRAGKPVERCRVTIELDAGAGAIESPSPGHFVGAARFAVQEALKTARENGDVAILEPVMLTHIRCPEMCAGAIGHDITAVAGGHILEISDAGSRGGGGPEGGHGEAEDEEDDRIDESRVYAPPDPYETVTSLLELDSQQQQRRAGGARERRVEIVAKVPLAATLDYDARLRAITGGKHSMSSRFHAWERMAAGRAKTMEEGGVPSSTGPGQGC